MSDDSRNGLWACPRCYSVVATKDSTYPPGSENSSDNPISCAACKKRNIEPENWIRVSK